MLAYLFWHCPGADAGREDYELRLAAFHAELAERGYTTAAFRVPRLPFAERGGYEDWYLIDDWAALGALNDLAVYRSLRGDRLPRGRPRWLDKPAGASSFEFAGGLTAAVVWRRQLVLGPAPEFCVEDLDAPDRERVWPTCHLSA